MDTDAFNEVDDQFAMAYLLRSDAKLNTVAIYAAPFCNKNASSPLEGMEKSYDEIFKILKLADYLATYMIEDAKVRSMNGAWAWVVCDVVAVAWLLNEGDRFMISGIVPAALPTYDNLYAYDYNGHPIRYIYGINRGNLMDDLIEKIAGKSV